MTRAKQIGTGWQPIETAPKDGPHILGWRQAWSVPRSCHWSDYSQCWYADGKKTERPDFWPTHWLPMPKTPTRKWHEDAEKWEWNYDPR